MKTCPRAFGICSPRPSGELFFKFCRALIVSFLLGASAAYALDLPFLASNYSDFDPHFANSSAISANVRTLRIVVPHDFVEDSAPSYSPDGFGVASNPWPSSRPTVMFKKDPNNNFSVRGSVGVNSSISIFLLSHYEESLSEALMREFGSFPAMTSAISDVEINFEVQGGFAPGKSLRLNGKSAYGLQTRPPPSSGMSTIADAEFNIALEWGNDIFGAPQMLVISCEASAAVFSDDLDVLSLQEVASNLLGASSPAEYLQGVLNEYLVQPTAQTLKLFGAVPEWLVLYDFSAAHTLPVESTIPSAALFPDANGSYRDSYRYLNQYNAGVDLGLPQRFSQPNPSPIYTPGGNACGPVSLTMAINQYVAPGTSVIYDNTMQFGLNVAPNHSQAFAYPRAQSWLEGDPSYEGVNFSAPSGMPPHTSVYYIADQNPDRISNWWNLIDAILEDLKQPVLLRTNLSLGTGRGGGHVILLLGLGHSDDMRDLFGYSGDYYIVADPAGNYFANVSGAHYGTVETLIGQGVGINYGGWFARYPKELLMQRITSKAGTEQLMRFLTVTVPFPYLRVQARSPVTLLITDAQGRRTGMLINGSLVEEIPESLYIPAVGDEEEEGDTVSLPNGPKTVIVNHPPAGSYQVQLVGTGSGGAYTLQWNNVGAGGANPDMQSTSGTIAPGEEKVFSFVVPIGPTPTPSPTQTPSPTAVPSPTPSLAAKMGNISTRLKVLAGDNAMIGGFIITGMHTKEVIVRGIGPSLEAFGVQGALADPRIETRNSSGQLLAANDNWKDAANSQTIIDRKVAPTDEFEAALWGIIDPGAYTVVVRGQGDSTGVGVFEVFDLDQRVDSKLGNISTRGFVDTGDNVMIGGTILTGNTSAKILFRAIGPSLANFGVSNVLLDPTLELRDGDGALLASNDDWRSDDEVEIQATTIPPSNDHESAILRILTPGAYTAVLRGADNSTGVAVVEAYQLQ